MTPVPTPQPPDHGAAGFCTDHAQPPWARFPQIVARAHRRPDDAARAALDRVRARVAAEIIDVRRTPGTVKGAVGTRQRRHVDAALLDAATRVRSNTHAEDEYPAEWLDPMALDPEEPR